MWTRCLWCFIVRWRRFYQVGEADIQDYVPAQKILTECLKFFIIDYYIFERNADKIQASGCF